MYIATTAWEDPRPARSFLTVWAAGFGVVFFLELFDEFAVGLGVGVLLSLVRARRCLNSSLISFERGDVDGLVVAQQ